MEDGMGKDGPEVQMRLNGWLPGVERNGLGLVAEKLWQAFEEARRAGDETRDTVRTVVVGVLWVPDAKTPHPGSESDPEIHLKFEAVEPVLDEEELKQVTELLVELRARRRGDQPTLFTDSPQDPDRADGDVPASGGEATSKPAKKTAPKRGGLRALKTAAQEVEENRVSTEPPPAELVEAAAVLERDLPDPFTVQ
jgi:hypothetical protein